MVPHFGATPQVGFTYFCYKLCFLTFGLIAHEDKEKRYSFVCDRTQAYDKNSNHTMNFLLRFVIIYDHHKNL